ncbi:MAG: flagellar motor switch protein FliM [Gammaproteobacteria bacterium]
MTQDELLTKDEREALLEGIQESQATSRAHPNPDEVLPYKLVSPANAVTGILKVLDTIHERFAHRLRIRMNELLRRDVDVAPTAVEVCDYGEFMNSLRAPCAISLIAAQPLNGPGLLIFDHDLVFVLVDVFFGGKGRRYLPAAARDFTVVENRLLQRLREAVLRCMEAAWEPFVAVQCALLGVESNPQFVTAINTRDALAVTTVQVKLDDGQYALHLALPCAMFDPVRGALLASQSKDHPSHSERLRRLLGEGVKNSPVTVRALIGGTELSLREVLSLQAGDFIPLDDAMNAILEVDGVPVHAGHYGVAHGRRAVKIDRVLTEMPDPTFEENPP